MSIDSAERHLEKWHERKKLLLDEERAALNTACISFIQLLREEERAKFSISEAVLDAAIAAALSAIPGAIVLTKSWKASATAVGVLVTKEGEALAKLATGKGYEVARGLGKAIDRKASEGKDIKIQATASVFLDQYLEKALEPIFRAKIETLMIWERWLDILGSWDESLNGDPQPILNIVLPLPDIGSFRHRLAMFRVAAEYYLIGAYVKENVVVETLVRPASKGGMPHSTVLDVRVKGLNKTQLEIIYDKYAAASVMPKKKVSRTAFEGLEIAHRFEERVMKKDKQYITKAKTHKQWKDLFYETKLKDVNEDGDLVTVWGAKTARVNTAW